MATTFDEEDCKHSWREMDANNDGTVSLEEYVNFQMRNFGPMTYEDAYDGISYVMDVVDNLRSVPPCDGIITVSVRCQVGFSLCFCDFQSKMPFS